MSRQISTWRRIIFRIACTQNGVFAVHNVALFLSPHWNSSAQYWAHKKFWYPNSRLRALIISTCINTDRHAYALTGKRLYYLFDLLRSVFVILVMLTHDMPQNKIRLKPDFISLGAYTAQGASKSAQQSLAASENGALTSPKNEVKLNLQFLVILIR